MPMVIPLTIIYFPSESYEAMALKSLPNGKALYTYVINDNVIVM